MNTLTLTSNLVSIRLKALKIQRIKTCLIKVIRAFESLFGKQKILVVKGRNQGMNLAVSVFKSQPSNQMKLGG